MRLTRLTFSARGVRFCAHFLLCFSHRNDTGEIGEVAEFSGRSIEQPTLFSPVTAPWERHRFIRCSDVPFGGVCNFVRVRGSRQVSF